jgi:hypothetical protein
LRGIFFPITGIPVYTCHLAQVIVNSINEYLFPSPFHDDADGNAGPHTDSRTGSVRTNLPTQRAVHLMGGLFVCVALTTENTESTEIFNN